ncbi:flotillin family protein [Methylorubrum extorquens]|uniref:Inner membrane protein (YqiK-like) n=1 Tax=Methylorubrum extorquens (strain ATCC 14718 / DSM 1338 / JCM 2805 / NCIMB 9133 / AM1) TaxID=272630 RepID=C5ATC7_METEA|nr:flotillin domain-containing protein [Methylorubrum extorquens]ACS38437.1 putative inner membrane protein (yqiK-like) [Methylorubrum extorquens AM1]MCP1543503.1 putative membrane protein YqiK [Methylorubrum extorquens]MCP1589152.1 putative membrane protein YqiK [Methylorubrum extorquens]
MDLISPGIVNLLVIAGIIVVALLGIGFVFSRLYRRTTRDTAFVRTGLGGRKVVVDGGAVLLPVFHSIAMVNLNTLRLEVKRSGNESLITKDRLRADITVEFFVRVEPKEESIALAAQTLGDRTNDAMLLRELIEAKFVDALRSVAAGMTLPDLQEKRAAFVKGVQEAVSGDLRHNGLELESASLTRLDQTSIEHFNPDNSFDAEGLARLKEITEQRRKERNATERDAEVAVAEKDRETALKQLEIKRTTREAELAQERDIANKTAETRAETAQAEQRAQQSEETARIEREQVVRLREAEARKNSEGARIEADLAIAQRNAEAERERQLILQDNAIKIAERSEKESQARAAAKAAEALAVAAEERVATAKAKEIAEREREVTVIAAKQEAEREATGVTVTAEAERRAAEDRANAIITLAEAEATAASRAEAIAKLGQAEAERERVMNEARNALSAEARAFETGLKRLGIIPDALRESMRAVEKIDSIRIFDAGGMMGGGNGAGGVSANFGDSLSGHLLRYQYNSPILGAILNEAGFAEGKGSLDTLVGGLRNGTAVEPAANGHAAAAE